MNGIYNEISVLKKIVKKIPHHDVPLCYAVFTRHKSYLQIVCLLPSLTLSLLSIFTYSSGILFFYPDLSVSCCCSSSFSIPSFHLLLQTLIIFEFNNSIRFYSIFSFQSICWMLCMYRWTCLEQKKKKITSKQNKIWWREDVKRKKNSHELAFMRT
jgi:hypothetical protein